MPEIIIYTKTGCPFCANAKKLLAKKGLQYTEITTDNDPVSREEMMRLSGRHMVPQILINGKPIGGFDDLSAMDSSGQLDQLVKTG